MSFLYATYLLPIISFGVLIFLFFNFYDHKYYKWIEKYFFYKRTMKSRLSTFLYALGIFCLLISLLDLRGAEDNIKAEIGDQKTVVLIDVSASMLAEDVLPSRIQKAIIMARHFVSKAVGHQISVMIFSDELKRVVPFSDDIDHLDARINAISSLDINNNGSNILQAMSESLNYFKTEGAVEFGNLLVFTDGEDHVNFDGLQIPEGISVYIVGVGTSHGGVIPMRYKYNNQFLGNKRFNGQDVVTKLNDNFFKGLKSVIKNYSYQIATSTSMPTDDLITFFKRQYTKKVAKGDVKIRPVLSHYIAMVGIFIMILGMFFKLFNPYKLVIILCLLSLSGQDVFALENIRDMKKESIVLERYLERLKNGELNHSEKLKIAEMFLENKKDKDALNLYEELNNNFNAKSDSFVDANHATAKIKNQKVSDAILQYQHALKSEVNVDKRKLLVDAVRHNVLKAILSKGGQGKGKQKQDKNKEDEEKKQNNSGSGQNSKKDNKQDEKNKEGQKKQENEKSENDKKEKEQEKNNNQNQQQNDQRQDQKMSMEQREEMIKMQRRMVKTPAVLKQIMSEDSNLQKEFLNTQKNESSNRPKKDW